MSQPKVAAKSPKQMNLEPGEHHWCACGESKAQPFCDGSHRGSPFRPLAFTVELMQVMSRACGHTHLNQFTFDDITTWKKEMAELTGIPFAGVSPIPSSVEG